MEELLVSIASGLVQNPEAVKVTVDEPNDDNSESVTLACKAREWLDRLATAYLNRNDVIVQSVSSVTNRDNLLTTGYEYKNGFDVVFWLFDVIDNMADFAEYIDDVVLEPMD